MPKLLRNNAGALCFLFCIAFFRTAVADWSPVPSPSMEPTIHPGDVLLLDKTRLGPAIPFTGTRLWQRAQPRRGDIITFIPPAAGASTYVKRVIGVPGDRIRAEGLQVFVNGTALPLRVTDTGAATGILQAVETIDGREHGIQVDLRRGIRGQPEFVVPAESYFVMGDFRNDSEDSRFWGTVPEDSILALATHIAVSVAAERSVLSSIGTALQ